MVDIEAVLQRMPHFESFCSVDKLLKLVEELRGDRRFQVVEAGKSSGGVPIHHVRFGKGGLQVLVVGFPHCKEPVCGMTVFALVTLLRSGIESLCNADVTWHIVPCIDPDGAKLNEAWTQQEFSLERYMKNFYVQAPRDQVDMSFPISYKKLKWNEPSKEAGILKGILDEVKPDFFYSLHNSWTGGAFYYLSRDVGCKIHGGISEFLRREKFPLQTRPIWKEVCRQFAPGIVETWSIKKHYDKLEQTASSPEKLLRFGGASWDYLAEVKPESLTLLNEMGYVRHPLDESSREVEGSLRQFKLRIDADTKYLGTVLLEEWQRVREDVDTGHPVYRAIARGGVLPERDNLCDGGRPLSLHPTADILFNPEHAKAMTEGDLFQAIMVDGGFWGLCQSYSFVRLLKASKKSERIERAIARLERTYDDALAEIDRHVDLKAAWTVDCDTLARVQLGSGLIVLNSMIG